MSQRHNFDLANNEIEEVNKKERFHRNYAAIKVLKDCQRENRFATPDDQVILSKYVGWGGIPEAFDEGAGCEVLHLYYKRMRERMFLLCLYKCGKIVTVSKNVSEAK